MENQNEIQNEIINTAKVTDSISFLNEKSIDTDLVIDKFMLCMSTNDTQEINCNFTIDIGFYKALYACLITVMMLKNKRLISEETMDSFNSLNILLNQLVLQAFNNKVIEPISKKEYMENIKIFQEETMKLIEIENARKAKEDEAEAKRLDLLSMQN